MTNVYLETFLLSAVVIIWVKQATTSDFNHKPTVSRR